MKNPFSQPSSRGSTGSGTVVHGPLALLACDSVMNPACAGSPTTGPLRAASVLYDEESCSDVGAQIGAGGFGSGPPPEDGPAFLRACKGGHQGCPLATNLCILPYFLALSRTQALHPHARIASFADDTYSNASPRYYTPRMLRSAASAWARQPLASPRPARFARTFAKSTPPLPPAPLPTSLET